MKRISSHTPYRYAFENYGEVPSKDLAKLFKYVKRITGIDFPNARFREGQRKTVESRDELYEFSYSPSGIVIVQAHQGDIPNFKKLAAHFKKLFGDVHDNRPDYINARKWAQEPEEDALELPGTSADVIGPIKYMEKLSKKSRVKRSEAMAVCAGFRKAMDKRRVKTTGRPKFKWVSKTSYGTGKITSSTLMSIASSQYGDNDPAVFTELPIKESTRKIVSFNTDWNRDWPFSLILHKE
jgi:hypothetical protein